MKNNNANESTPRYAKGVLEINQSGPMTTVQDLGRHGGQHLGFCTSGAADEYSFLWANKLLDNSPSCAALEITLGPFSCTFQAATHIAITGAQAEIWLNDRKLQGWQNLRVKKGDTLKCGLANSGVYLYLAVSGGFYPAGNTQKFFDSYSMVSREQSGPFNGGPLKKGHALHYCPQSESSLHPANAREFYSVKQNRFVSFQYIPDYQAPLSLGLLPSYQFENLDQQSLSELFTHKYTIGSDSNKMGVRLTGTALQIEKDSLLSEGIAYGAVQIPANGQPIILLKDRQTIGGYPKIGCVSKLDAFQLSQRRPGQEIIFKPTSLEESQHDLKEFYTFFGQR